MDFSAIAYENSQAKNQVVFDNRMSYHLLPFRGAIRGILLNAAIWQHLTVDAAHGEAIYYEALKSNDVATMRAIEVNKS